jgi:hypothetical protein
MGKTIMLEGRLEPYPPRQRFTLVTLVALAAALAGSLTSASPAHGGPHVRVHASSTIDAHAYRSGGKLLFRGTLADEVGHRLGGQPITVTVVQGGQHVSAAIEACPGAAAGNFIVDRSRPVLVQTDAVGSFCVAVSASQETSSAHFEWGGTVLIDGATADVTADPSRRQVDLRLPPLESYPVIDLASESFVLDVEARIVGEGPEAPAGGLPLVLTNEGGSEVARATTSSAGQARFALSPVRRLGAPGRGELRVDFFDGDPTTSAPWIGILVVRRVVEVERRVEVRLTVPGVTETLAAANPEDGVTIPIAATTTTGDPVSTGVVEASVGGRAVGAAPIQGGHAELVATFPAEGSVADIQVRYAGDAPWYAPGPEVSVRLPIVASSPWRRAPLLAASLAVVLWLALGRTRRRTAVLAAPVPRKRPVGEARVDVVRPAADSRVGWTGQVIDAHDGIGIGSAEVRVERPAFGGTEVLAGTKTNDAGRFELRCDSARRGDQLVVSGHLHATLVKNLPALGQMEIALVLRRRALLDRLVSWARRRGQPFDASPEATPGHVARVGRGDADTRAWAEAVERAGFGPDVIDALAESRIDRIAPQGARAKR